MTDLTHKSRMEVATKSECPVFLRSTNPIILREETYHMISSTDINIATWAKDGRSFYVKDVKTLAKTILPQYFKHSNFSSFVRQLNFYGFTKAKDIKLTTDSNESKYWEFRHSDFRRDDPHLLVKIVRRTSTSTTSNSSGSGQSQKRYVKDGPLSAEANAAELKEKKERSNVAEEIESLKVKLHSMENEIKKLSDVMVSTTIQDNNYNITQKGQAGGEPILRKETSVNRRVHGPNKKRILVKDSELFGNSNTHSHASTNNLTTSLSDLSPVRGAQTTSPMTFAVSTHAASIDLPDLSMAASDADLFLEDQQSAASTGEKLNQRGSSSNSSRRGSMAMNIVNDTLNNTWNSSQSDVCGVVAEVDQIVSSLESNLTSYVPIISSSQDHSNILSQEPLPTVVMDEGNDEPSPRPKDSSISPPSSTRKKRNNETKRPMRSRNLLDQNHILNLEKCLASLPIPDRIKFVQDVMNNISGLDDLIKQGLSIVAKGDPANADIDIVSLSRARQVVESGIDTSLLSALESLLFRVGLRIQLNTIQKSESRQSTKATANVNFSRRNSSRNKKDSSSFVEIPLEV